MEKLLHAFIDRVNKENLPTEGILWAEGENIRLEHHFKPDVPRNIYSHTKSFTATAAGMAIDAGKLHLEDKVADFFPDIIPENADPRVREITLKHVLNMASGFNVPLLMMPKRYEGEGAPDYLRYIYAHPLQKDPGSMFCYSNGDTYTVGRMVEKAMGMPLEDILKEKLFIPAGMDSTPEWEHCPMGHAFGASGLLLRLRDMCKIGIVYLQKGMYQGKRILSESWVDDARKVHISTNDNPAPQDWNNGYGYQCWKLPYGESYRFDGAYGQFTCILPEHHYVVSLQHTENDCTPLITKALHEEIFSKLYQ